LIQNLVLSNQKCQHFISHPNKRVPKARKIQILVPNEQNHN